MDKRNTNFLAKNFKEAFDMVPKGAVRRVKKEIKEVEGWGNDLFYKKLRGDRGLKGCEKLALNNILGEFKIEIQ